MAGEKTEKPTGRRLSEAKRRGQIARSRDLTVAFSTLVATGVLGMFGLNRLPMHYHPLFKSKVFERVTDDAFFISIESWDPRFDASATGKLLESLGARSVELLES